MNSESFVVNTFDSSVKGVVPSNDTSNIGSKNSHIKVILNTESRFSPRGHRSDRYGNHGKKPKTSEPGQRACYTKNFEPQNSKVDSLPKRGQTDMHMGIKIFPSQ